MVARTTEKGSETGTESRLREGDIENKNRSVHDFSSESSLKNSLQGPLPFHWDYCSCPLCHHDEATCYIEAPDPNPSQFGNEEYWFAVMQCNNCKLKYTQPRPTPETIHRFYANNYLPHRKPKALRKLVRSRSPFGILRGRAGERRSLPWHGQGRLLDFGCGGGSFLVRMSDQGWKVIGLDVSETVVKNIREKLGLTAFVGSLPHAELKPCSFDVITMWHSLEHVHQPVEILQEAFRLLVPKGKILIAVPNIDSWAFHWFKKSWFALGLPRHLIHFAQT